MNIVGETGADEFSPTHFSNALTIPTYRDGDQLLARPFTGRLVISKTQNPRNIADGPFQHAHHTKEPFFVWLGERPEHSEHFNNYMSGYRQGKRRWMDEGFYPLKERLGADTPNDDKNPVLLVDVGGGLGHDLEELKVKHPGIRGRLVLQDQPEVIAQIGKASDGTELTTHDFFTPQSVKGSHQNWFELREKLTGRDLGARAYYLHSVLHDWDDASCLKILRNVVPAMRPGYSKLLINENVVPDVGAAWSITSMDWLMMALGAVRERTEKQWRGLLGQAGLKVTGVWTYEQGTESLIEAETET
ncbi:hypothetical protein HO133_008322 [Letharia lupina]|uniref:O-methyltransferase C-terminal domain-containing protein n=1 Tax=Letharia lupina TaxID=560253 RepID=A0A8H6FG54_9LECA|nr:uncharacterized protein HO133_008322 [Letharia lupina]KAF6226881.1 hypothetical protein HO133_008322 [Letharia lupina]